MKRFALLAAVAAVAAGAFAAWGLAQPTAKATTASPEVRKPNLPKLPANIAARKCFLIGIKCDVPPFGYIDVRGRNAGFDVEIAKWFSRYAFGRENRVSYTCAPTPARESVDAARANPRTAGYPAYL